VTDTQKWQLLALTVLLAALLYWLRPVLTPFAAAALLAYLGDPLVGRLERAGLSRGIGVLVVFSSMGIALLVALIVLVPMIERQLVHLIMDLPNYVAWLRGWLEPQFARLGVDLSEWDAPRLKELLLAHWKEAGGAASQVLGAIGRSGWAAVHVLTSLVLIPVVAFYFLRDWPMLVERVRELLPRTVEPTISRLARESDEVLGAFLRGQLLMMLAMMVIYTVGLWLCDIDLALLIGTGAGLVSFVPYLGAILGVGAALIATLVQHPDPTHIAMVLAVFGIGHAIEGYVLQPWLIGDRIGLHPVAVMFAIFCGAELGGFLGVLLALPVAAVALVLLRHAHERYVGSALYAASDDEAQATIPDAPTGVAAEPPPAAPAASPAPAPAPDAGAGHAPPEPR